MGIPSDFWFRISGLFLILAVASCSKQQPSPATQPTTPTVASLVPAATDLIVGMGARNRLVAVSTYDDQNPSVAQLPKAGNYDTVNWELLQSLHPSLLISEIAPDRQSAGFKANAADLHITPINVKIETLGDIFAAIDQLGDALQEPQLAHAAEQSMRSRLDAVRQSSTARKPIRTLIVIDATADAVVGPGTYLDDLLKIAGGENVLDRSMGHWPTIDREKLLSLHPDAILQLLPGATPQERDQAAAVWKQLPTIPAVANARVYPIYDNYALLPGWHVTDLAETFSKCLGGGL